MAVGRISNYRPLKSGGSLKAFYDDIVYWEMAKRSNKFYVTFMKGEYGFPNNKQESIATMEITYPHVAQGYDSSTGSFQTGYNRVSNPANVFQQTSESLAVGSSVRNSHQYNGFITITEINSRRYWQSTITSSISVTRTYDYQVNDSVLGTTTQSRTVEAAYFYPFSSHQLSVLRDEPTLVVDLNKESELDEGLGDSGFVLIPQDCHPKVKNNIEYYLEKAGLIDKTTKFKNQSPRR